MNIDRTLLAALLFIALVIGSNLVMYGIVRGFSRGDGHWLQALTKNLNKPLGHKDESMDELRRRVKKLSRGEESKRPE
jgi:hypothetical protein